MTDSIEAICHEYAEDALFSQDVSECGAPLKIIVHIKYEYISELTKFLSNYGYEYSSNKKSGKYFTLVHFQLLNKKIIDCNNQDRLGEI